MNHFHFISDFGKINLPTKSEIDQLMTENGEHLLLILDTSVCLDIVNIIKRKQSAQADKAKVFNLIEYAQKNKVDWLAIFALLESCYDRKTLELQEEKLVDFKHKIDFAFHFPIKLLKRFEFDFGTNYRGYDTSKFQEKSVALVTDELSVHYAALLKIHELARGGLTKELAEKNIETFLNWMVNDLDSILGLEYSLALRIFGGDTKFRSMIKLGAAKEKVIRAVWGTAWDLFHARVSCNRIQLSNLIGRKVCPVFVTKDGNLFELLSPQVSEYYKYNSTKLSVTEKNEYPPHYSDVFMNQLNMKMLRLASARLNKVTRPSVGTTIPIIKNLEESLS